MVDHLTTLLDRADVVPAVNQIEVHPYFVQPEVQAFGAEHGILTQAWSPIGGITFYREGEHTSTLQDPVIGDIARAHGKTPAQVMLRWGIQHGRSVIPKSTKPSRIAENIDVFDFELTADEMAAIDALDTGRRGGPEPEAITLEAFGRADPGGLIMTETRWPALRVDDWTATRETLHRWMQIVGKIRLAQAPMVNHWWQVTLYVTPRGLTTSAMPSGDGGTFEIEFDFCAHRLRITVEGGQQREVALEPKTVAAFYAEVLDALASLGPGDHDLARPGRDRGRRPVRAGHRARELRPAGRELFWRQLVQADRVMTGSARASAARSAPCTSSGARWTWP